VKKSTLRLGGREGAHGGGALEAAMDHVCAGVEVRRAASVLWQGISALLGEAARVSVAARMGQQRR
jgi:hypothetical protein